MTQLAAFMHDNKTLLLGTIFGGRFPIHNWPRPLMWAFEWHDTSQYLVLKRGDPWFYVQFETSPQDRAVSMVAAENTPELAKYLEHITASVNYVNQIFSLFERGRMRKIEDFGSARYAKPDKNLHFSGYFRIYDMN